MDNLPKDPFAIILTSVGVELLSFRKKTGKITNEEEEHLTSAIVERVVRKLKEHGCYQLATDGREELEKENERLKALIKDAYYYRTGGPRDDHGWQQFKSANKL